MIVKYKFREVPFESLLGKTINCIKQKDPNDLSEFPHLRGLEGDVLYFLCEGKEYIMDHSYSCCESVYIEDICGNLDWLIGTPILRAEEKTNQHSSEDKQETWTFYELATINVSVTIRWYGTSNGYYSTKVNFYCLEELSCYE